jgi:hypothetical protein
VRTWKNSAPGEAALLIESEELEMLRLGGEGARSGEGGIDLRVIGTKLASVLIEAESEKVVL